MCVAAEKAKQLHWCQWGCGRFASIKGVMTSHELRCSQAPAPPEAPAPVQAQRSLVGDNAPKDQQTRSFFWGPQANGKKRNKKQQKSFSEDGLYFWRQKGLHKKKTWQQITFATNHFLR